VINEYFGMEIAEIGLFTCFLKNIGSNEMNPISYYQQQYKIN